MNELEEHIMQFGSWEHYYQHLLFTYGHTQQQKNAFILKTHTPDIQSYRGRQNTSAQQSIKGKKGGLNNTKEQQSAKGLIGGLNNTSEQQSIKGLNNTKEQQSIKGLNNTKEQQSIKGKKSEQVRYDGSNEQLKPWAALGISRSWYYTQKSLGNI